jgi:hypothetical protein
LLDRSVNGARSFQDKDGFRNAAAVLALELDGTRAGLDRVADFYSRRCVEAGRHPSINELLTAHDLATGGVSKEIGERILAAEIQIDYPSFADELAKDALNRGLTEDEILALVDVHTHGASRGMDDRDEYLALAKKNNASEETIRKIIGAFNCFDEEWESDIL